MMGGSETVSGDQDVVQTAVHVPIGWQRRAEGGRVVYVSPSGASLSSLEEVKAYLLTDGTCKCGLECPLVLHKVFSFAVEVKVEQCSGPLGKVDQDMTKLCNHRRKVVAMAALRRSMHSPLPYSSHLLPEESSGRMRRLHRERGDDPRAPPAPLRSLLSPPSPRRLPFPPTQNGCSDRRLPPPCSGYRSPHPPDTPGSPRFYLLSSPPAASPHSRLSSPSEQEASSRRKSASPKPPSPLSPSPLSPSPLTHFHKHRLEGVLEQLKQSSQSLQPLSQKPLPYAPAHFNNHGKTSFPASSLLSAAAKAQVLAQLPPGQVPGQTPHVGSPPPQHKVTNSTLSPPSGPPPGRPQGERGAPHRKRQRRPPAVRGAESCPMNLSTPRPCSTSALLPRSRTQTEALDFTTGSPLTLEPPTQPLSALLHLLSVQNAQNAQNAADATDTNKLLNKAPLFPSTYRQTDTNLSLLQPQPSPPHRRSPMSSSHSSHSFTQSPLQESQCPGGSPKPLDLSTHVLALLAQAQGDSAHNHHHTSSPQCTGFEESVCLDRKNSALTSPPALPQATAQRTSPPALPQATAQRTSPPALPQATAQRTSPPALPQATAQRTSPPALPQATAQRTSPPALPQATAQRTSPPALPQATAQKTSPPALPQATAQRTSPPTLPQATAQRTSPPTLPQTLPGGDSAPSPLAEAFPFMNQEQLLQLLSSGSLPSLLDPAVLASLPLGGLWPPPQTPPGLEQPEQLLLSHEHKLSPLFPLLPLLSAAQGELPLNLLGLNPLPPAGSPPPGQEGDLGGGCEKPGLQALLMASLLLGQQGPLLPLGLEVPLQPPALDSLSLDKPLMEPLLELPQGFPLSTASELLLPPPTSFLPLSPALLSAALSSAELHPPPSPQLGPSQPPHQPPPQADGVDALIPLHLQSKDNPLLQQLLPTLLNTAVLGDLSNITNLQNLLGLGPGSILLPPVQASALGLPLLQSHDGTINLLNNLQLSITTSEEEKPVSMEKQSSAPQGDIPANQSVDVQPEAPPPEPPPKPTGPRSVIDPYTSFMDTIYSSFLQVSAREQQEGARLGPSDPSFCALPLDTLPQACAPVALSPRRACSLRNPELSRLSLEASAHSPAQGTPRPTEEAHRRSLPPVFLEEAKTDCRRPTEEAHRRSLPPVFLEEAQTDCRRPTEEAHRRRPPPGFLSPGDNCREDGPRTLLDQHTTDAVGGLGEARRGRKRKQLLQNVLEDFRELDSSALDESELKSDRSVRGRRRRGTRSQRQ
ncbi:unnamed protein product [Knipowitschia caucasica]